MRKRIDLELLKGMDTSLRNGFRKIRGVIKDNELFRFKTFSTIDTQSSTYLGTIYNKDGLELIKKVSSTSIAGDKTVPVENVSHDFGQDEYNIIMGSTDSGVIPSPLKIQLPSLDESRLSSNFITPYDSYDNTLIYKAKINAFSGGNGYYNDMFQISDESIVRVNIFGYPYGYDRGNSGGISSTRYGSIVIRKFKSAGGLYKPYLSREIVIDTFVFQSSVHFNGKDFLSFISIEEDNIVNVRVVNLLTLDIEIVGVLGSVTDTNAEDLFNWATVCGEKKIAIVKGSNWTNANGYYEIINLNEKTEITEISGTLLVNTFGSRSVTGFKNIATDQNQYYAIHMTGVFPPGSNTLNFIEFLEDTTLETMTPTERTFTFTAAETLETVLTSCIYGTNIYVLSHGLSSSNFCHKVDITGAPSYTSQESFNSSGYSVSNLILLKINSASIDLYLCDRYGVIIKWNGTSPTNFFDSGDMDTSVGSGIDTVSSFGLSETSQTTSGLAGKAGTPVGFVAMSFFVEYDNGAFSGIAPSEFLPVFDNSTFYFSVSFNKLTESLEILRVRNVHILSSRLQDGTTVSIDFSSNLRIVTSFRLNDFTKKFTAIGDRSIVFSFGRDVIDGYELGSSYESFTGRASGVGLPFKNKLTKIIGDDVFFAGVISEEEIKSTMFYTTTDRVQEMEINRFNYINLPEIREITAMGSLRGNLVAFGINSVTVVINKATVETAIGYGCVHQGAVTEVFGRCIFFHDNDFYSYDGTEFTNLTDNLDSFLKVADANGMPCSTFDERTGCLLMSYGNTYIIVFNVKQRAYTYMDTDHIGVNRAVNTFYNLKDRVGIDLHNGTDTVRAYYQEDFGSLASYPSIEATSNDIFPDNFELNLKKVFIYSRSVDASDSRLSITAENQGTDIVIERDFSSAPDRDRLNQVYCFAKCDSLQVELVSTPNRISKIKGIQIEVDER
jgi:hypothetical protein